MRLFLFGEDIITLLQITANGNRIRPGDLDWYLKILSPVYF